mmetsp:Transcript_13771/g.17314  ORF Transcript_13771/g.17314 Transcript_13771/m.17314 type:complete len:145 (-) Transcript_13771:159-593(-)|eukprot:CAMPEP_0172489390 /NCGR_PEP_ID=MMETSP1066-20121228/19338_1 /TAXON_ID=671091 /ORGANISM="Coscinodiscus wailesii, Strain CCMP2513" /LENGTH=144 /DNA_ID=CAMNT_0013257193 /DNA_START=257 /DNA_END=691 /DNA_ORIENTATION=-
MIKTHDDTPVCEEHKEDPAEVETTENVPKSSKYISHNVYDTDVDANPVNGNAPSVITPPKRTNVENIVTPPRRNYTTFTTMKTDYETVVKLCEGFIKLLELNLDKCLSINYQAETYTLDQDIMDAYESITVDKLHHDLLYQYLS